MNYFKKLLQCVHICCVLCALTIAFEITTPPTTDTINFDYDDDTHNNASHDALTASTESTTTTNFNYDEESRTSDSTATSDDTITESAEYEDYEYDEEENSTESGGEEEVSSETCFNTFVVDKLNAVYEKDVNRTLSRHVSHINETFEFADRLLNLTRSLLYYPSILAQISEYVLTTVDLEPECFASLLLIFQAIQKNEIWPYKSPELCLIPIIIIVFDSSAKLPNGYLDGLLSDFGEYDECLAISSPKEPLKLVVRGQYCLVKLIVPYPPRNSFKPGDVEPIYFKEAGRYFFDEYDNKLENLHSMAKLIDLLHFTEGRIFQFGLCVPALCEPSEIQAAINKIVYPLTRLQVELGPQCQEREEKRHYDPYQVFSITILTVLLLLVVLSTTYEKLQGSAPYASKSHQLLQSFSLISNTKSLFVDQTRFASLDTLRLLIIVNVFCVHVYLFSPLLGITALKKIFNSYPVHILHYSRYTLVRNGMVLDALLAMSGFILSFALLGKLRKNDGRFNYFSYLCLRWLRLSVPLFGSFLFFYVYPLAGDGPIWEVGVNWIVPPCQHWFTFLSSFLYISNYNSEFGIFDRQNSFTLCNSPTWFLSVLFQLDVIAPFFICLYYKKPKLGLYVNIGVIIVGSLASIAPNLLYGIKPWMLFIDNDFDGMFKSWTWNHMSTTAYISSFLVGILFGYLLRENVQFTDRTVKVCWYLAPISITCVYLWNNTFWTLDKKDMTASVLLWLSVGKLMYSFGFAWIYLACCSGKGGAFNKLMCWPGFRPFNRLSFGIYLLHYLMVFNRIFSVKQTHVLTDSVMLQNIFFDLVKVTIFSYIFYLIIECPFTTIFTILFKAREPPNETTTAEKSEESTSKGEINLAFTGEKASASASVVYDVVALDGNSNQVILKKHYSSAL